MEKSIQYMKNINFIIVRSMWTIIYLMPNIDSPWTDIRVNLNREIWDNILINIRINIKSLNPL